MADRRFIQRLCASSLLAGLPAAQIATPAVAQDEQAYGDFVSADEVAETDEILFEADHVFREVENGPIIAEGNVRAFFGERYLRADTLSYDPATAVVTANGNVSITDGDLETLFSSRVVLSGDLRDGVSENFSALLEDNTRLAAERAVQEQGARTRLSRAIFTACDVCNDDNETKTPTWQIKSLRVTRDRERKVVRFHHAFFELKGVPVLYTPFLQGPDPSVERQSGFLPPRIGTSSRLGFNFELPYYLAISNSQDATFFPKVTTRDGVLWQGEYRNRGSRGFHVLSGGVINFDPITPQEEEELPGVRWHYFGRGFRDFGDHWRASYDFERVSDDTYLRQYDVERRGDLRQELDRGDTNQLRSNARLAWNKNAHSLSIDTFLFQGLRAVDDASTTPIVLPLINYRHDFKKKYFGGRANVNANIASLYRTGGADSQRFTASANWSRDTITPGGHRFEVFAEVRGDAYFLQDLDQGTEIVPGTLGDSNRFISRFIPTAGVEWSYPLARKFAGAQVFLEPRVQLIAGLSGRNDFDILNEDSQSIEFDYAGLFDFNKATGFDAVEDGQRANVGIASSIVWPNGLSIEGEIGQQFRVQETQAFSATSGLGEETSDFVGSLNIRYGNRFGLENRFRFDDNDGSFSRAESLAFLNLGRVNTNVSYVRLNEENVSANLIQREELTASTAVTLTDHWSIGGAWRVDLVENQTIQQDVTIGYQDECSTFGLTFRRDRTFQNTLEPDNQVLLTFTLRSLVN